MTIQSKNFSTKILTLPFILYFLFTIGLIFVQKPWEDEAMFTNASYNLVENGYLAIPGFVRTYGTRGLDKGVYWLPPLNMLTSAGWFKIVGYGLLQQRMLAAIFGFIGLLAFYFFLKLLNFENKFIFIVLLLISVDFLYTRHSANGRLADIMCHSICLLGFVAYLLLREKKFELSIFVSNVFVALAGLTHPNALLGFAGLIFLTLFLDFKKVKIKTILIATLPYLIGLICVSFYILKDIDAFLSQFWYGNVLTAGKQNLLELVKNEFVKRYGMIYFGLGLKFPPSSRILILLPLLYFASVIYTGFKIKENKSIKIIFWLTLTYFFVMTFVLAKKWNVNYLIYIIPFYSCCVALMYIEFKKHKQMFVRSIVNFILCVMLVLSIGVNIYRYTKNDYKKYITDTNKIAEIIGKQGKVFGPLELGFSLGWENVLDDVTLGYLSGKSYDYLVMPKYGYNIPDESLSVTDPQIYEYVVGAYKKFNPIWEGKIYNLYKRYE